MIGILVILAISWLLLYFIEKKHITALGLLPVGKRLKQFGIGFLITAVLCVLTQILEAFLREASWRVNEAITPQAVLQSIWWDLKSVLTEELLFRGALLYILIHRLGSKAAIAISAIAFGVYHWFSYGMFSVSLGMIVVFLGTGLMGFAWAWAFAKTRSIFLPLGLHLGWNVIYNTLFSKGPLGESILSPTTGEALTGWPSFFNFITGLVIVPIIVLLYVRYGIKSQTAQ